MPRPLHADYARLRDETGFDIPDEVLSRALLIWTGLFGTISYELFGHLHRVVEDYDTFFEHQVDRLGTVLTGGP